MNYKFKSKSHILFNFSLKILISLGFLSLLVFKEITEYKEKNLNGYHVLLN